MQNRVNGRFNQQPNSEPSTGSSTKKNEKPAGEYIDFEELK